MRLTKSSWVVLAVAVFAIAFASLYFVLSRQNSEHSDLESTLAQVQGRYSQLASRMENLEEQIDQRESELAAELSKLGQAKTRFPSSVQSLDYYQRLLAFADDCNLTVVGLAASAPQLRSAEGVTYLVTVFNVAVNGDTDDILDFIHTLVTSEHFTNAALQALHLGIPQPDSEEGGIAAKSEATFRVEIYAYPGE